MITKATPYIKSSAKLFRSFFQLALILLLLSTVISAQNSKVIGNVTDMDTGDPLFGANVFIEGTSIGAATDIDGNFVLPIVPLGTYTLVVRFIGFNEQRQEFTLSDPNRTLQLDFELRAVALEGQEVVISAQAMGQKQAINQQISSNTIKNVVSAARIQELPDATAAESIGRLPGVSISRSGGEANKVLVRGLVPHVQIDGVTMGSIERTNRNADISMISPNMLDGIDLTKALTADMEADRLGGTVNLTVRKAPQQFYQDVLIQGGYDDQEQSYGNFKIVGAVGNRFLEKKFGVYFNAYFEERDRGTDQLNPNFEEDFRLPEDQRDDYLALSNISFQDVAETRTRYGGTLVLDYELPFGSLKMTNFGSRMNREQLIHNQSVQGLSGNLWSGGIVKSGDNFVNQIANRLYGEFEILSGNLDVEFAHSFTGSDQPLERNISWYGRYLLDDNLKTTDKYLDWINQLTLDDVDLKMNNVGETLTESIEREYKMGLNYELPFSFGDFFSGSIKFGGLYKYSIREYNTDNRSLKVHGNDYDVWQAIVAYDPDVWVNRNNLGELFLPDGFDDHFDNDKYLDGKYDLKPWVSLDLMDRVHEASWAHYENNGFPPSIPTANFINDQDGTEEMTAGYIMPTFKMFDNLVTIIPGFRYEKLNYEYSGNNLVVPVGIETNDTYWNDRNVDKDTSTTIHENWFPMIHLKVQPLDWLDVRLAYTKTALRPRYDDIVPSSQIHPNALTINRGNPGLDPQLSENWDLYASFYSNTIGFFSIGAFQKNITDGIIRSGIFLPDTVELNRFGLDQNYLGFTITTPLNSDYTEYIKGFEIDWQTHFWYLPFPFDGLVLNLNYTYIDSQSETYLPIIRRDNSTFPPTKIRIDSSYVTDQFKNFFNVSLGYDYKGFSGRISYLYQAKTKTSFQQKNYLNTYKLPYSRLDIKIRQKLPLEGLELFVNLNNLTSTGDEFYQQREFYVDLEERWGFTGDIGLRYRIQ